MQFKIVKFIKYFSASGIATLVNIGSRVALSNCLTFSISVIIAYFIGHIVNYILSAVFVFNKQDGSNNICIRTFLKFTLVAFGGLLVTFVVSYVSRHLLLSIFGTETIKFIELLAHVCGVGFAFICNYVGHTIFSFKIKENSI